jgi:prepilin-type N-terminal cleavage/methylation domain-containing protein
MMRLPHTSHRRQDGFTIVELMIATLVFAMVLILITVGVLSFTKSYYKGVNQSATQNAARTVIEDVSQAIQFSGDAVTTDLGTTNNSKGFCIGNRRYSYLLGKQLWDDGNPDSNLNQTRHALVLDQAGSCGGMSPQDVANLPAALVSGSTEMLQPRMRLAKLNIQRQGTSDLYRINVRVIYGDDDLLINPTAADARCKVSISGSQYCAESELSTTVKKRIVQ